MLKQTSLKTEMVVAMTLAEVFLLLLFMVWYGQVVEAKEGTPLEGWKAVAADRLQKINQLEDQLRKTSKENAELSARLDFWRTHFGSEPPGSVAQLEQIIRKTEAGRQFLKRASRDYPPCEENANILVNASVLNGRIRLSVVGQSMRFVSWGRQNNIPVQPAGSVITDWNAANRYLANLRSFYSFAEAQDSACRFDYRLEYGNAEDYLLARENLERFFYVAGISKGKANSRLN